MKKEKIMIRKSTLNRTVFLMLPFFGVSRQKSVILITRLIWLVVMIFTYYCHYLYFSTHLNSQNFFNLVDCLSSFLALGKVLAKLIVFWINQRKIEETLMLITDDWNNYAKNDIGMHVMTDKAKTSDRIVNMMFFLHVISIIAYTMGIILANADVTDETIELPFVNKLKFPFSIKTQGMYRFVLLLQVVQLLFANLAAGIVNSILLSLVLHAGGQIDILQCWMAESASFKGIKNKQESIITSIDKIIRKHQKIIQFSENIEMLYTHIALILFASNTMLICLLGFLIVTAIGTANVMEQILKCLLFYIVTNLEAFIFCYAGEYLNNKSREIAFATYNCAWYNLKPKDNRVLLFIILRSQKQLTLTAGKIINLTLQSFTSIMNASGSYLSVLLAMQ